jgi:integrase
MTKSKRHVRARDFGMDTPQSQREAKRLERIALNARDARRTGAQDETCDVFAERWTRDYPRGESTNAHNAERVKKFGSDFAGRPLRSIARTEARSWSTQNPGRVPAVRAMFNDAVKDELADSNPFAKLGRRRLPPPKVTSPVTVSELDALADYAVTVHGSDWGTTFRAMILVAAYTAVRLGELCAMRLSLIAGDEYDLRRQFNSTLGRETEPKHGSSGVIFLPAPARAAIATLPASATDDLLFRGKRGQQMRQESVYRAWDPVRAAFGRPDLRFNSLRHFGATYMLNDLGLEPWVIAEQLRHKDGGVLVLQTYGHPSRAVARERIRRAYGENVKPLRGSWGDGRGNAQEDSA